LYRRARLIVKADLQLGPDAGQTIGDCRVPAHAAGGKPVSGKCLFV
jgi:hypothetical protein